MSENSGAANETAPTSDHQPIDDPKVFVLKRELSEVHLLLDNLSANPEETISLASGPPSDLPSDWIEQVCAVNWPPAGSNTDQAKQASLLIRAKDYLNSRAKPASGATIAFTLLVTQEDNATGVGLWHRLRKRRAAPSRHSLATVAYPGLVAKASEFRAIMISISCILCVFLFVTCFLSWYTAFGNATLAQRAAAASVLLDAQKRIGDAESGIGKPPPPAGNPSGDSATVDGGRTPSPPSSSEAAASKSPLVIHLCDKSRLLPPVEANGQKLEQFTSIPDMQACSSLATAKQALASIDGTLLSWLQVLHLGSREFGSDGGNSIALYSSSIVSLLATSILPVLYGILGAAAAVVRSLSSQIRASLLAPRDLHLSLQQLALGAVMGACIGLFVSQPSAPNNAANLVGAVALSSSALSFVAGFGVERVFNALEMVISRIFTVVPASKS